MLVNKLGFCENCQNLRKLRFPKITIFGPKLNECYNVVEHVEKVLFHVENAGIIEIWAICGKKPIGGIWQ